jgi:hypothetical protein
MDRHSIPRELCEDRTLTESGGDQPTDGKGKGRPSVRRMWLGRLRNLPTSPTHPAGAFTKSSKDFKHRSAVASDRPGALGHDNAR